MNDRRISDGDAWQLLGALPVASCVFDSSGVVLRWNQACADLLQLPESTIVGRPVRDIQPPKLGLELAQVVHELLAGSAHSQVEVEFFDGSGMLRCIACQGSVARQEGSTPCGILVLTDVSDQRRQLHRSKVLAMVAQHAMNAVLITDASQNIVFANPAFCEMTGYTLGEIMGRRPRDLLQGTESDLEARAAMRRAIEQREPVRVELVNYRKDGDPYWVAISLNPIFDERGQLVNFIAIQDDITARKEMERELAERTRQLEAYNTLLERNQHELEQANTRLRSLATTDGLTGLCNYRRFRQVLDQEFAYAQTAGVPLSVCVLDVDRFKSYNDSFGHPAGDDALRLMANVLTSNVRGTDFVARYGGEEFVVVMPKADEVEAIRVGERLRRAVEAAAWPKAPLTASFGISTLAPNDRVDDLIVKADQALYTSKANGRNRVTHSGSVSAQAA